MENKQQYQGLNPEQVAESRRLHGENVLTPPEKTSLWKQFLEKFEDPIIRILLVAWVLSMVIAGVHCWGPEAAGFSAFLEPLGIFFAIMLASCVGFFFEVKANRAFDVLNTVNDDILVTVVRGGKITEVPRRDIVVGDVVLLGTGDEVPADGMYNYTIIAYLDERAGAESEDVAVWIGNDMPADVERVTAQLNEDGKPEISFTPVTRGANGGYVDPDAVRYKS